MLRAVALTGLVALAAGQAAAAAVVAVRTIRAAETIAPGDVRLVEDDIPGAVTDPGAVVGQEARVMLYAGRPIRPEQVGAPALVERNQKVSLVYSSGGLRIEAEGRALGRAALGETVQAMNLASRKTVMGTVAADGSVRVSQETR